MKKTHAHMDVYTSRLYRLEDVREMNDGTWYATGCSMLDRRKQEHSLEDAFKRVSSAVRERNVKKKERLSNRG